MFDLDHNIYDEMERMTERGASEDEMKAYIVPILNNRVREVTSEMTRLLRNAFSSNHFKKNATFWVEMQTIYNRLVPIWRIIDPNGSLSFQ